jgi:hypothetical protein
MPAKKMGTKERSNLFYLVFVPAAAVLAIAAGWSVFWYVKSHQAAAAVSKWMAHEAELGRSWACPNQKAGGFPFSIEISCDNLLFQGNVSGRTLTGTVRGFHAVAPLLRTDNILVRLEPPFSVTTSDGALDVTMNWGEFYIELEGEPGAPQRLAMAGTELKLQGRAGGTVPVDGGFKEFHSYVSLASDRHDNSYDFMFSLNDGSVPAVNDFLDTQLPLKVEFGGTISQAELGRAGTFSEFLEKWRSANGHIDVSTARLKSGGASFEATGGFDLDEQHRVKGRLDAAFAGFGKAFRQLNIDPGLVAAGQALSGVLGGRGAGGIPGRFNLPVSFSGGFLSIGPVRTSIQLPPLY